MSNRHGLIAGATGTGKTVSLQILAEGFSRHGVPVFAADIKGDLSGVAVPGNPHPEVTRRIESIGVDGFAHRGFPTVFWDIFGQTGHPVRTTISELGPLILSNLLDLNDTQTGILYACFAIADDEGLLLLDLKDLRSLLAWMGDNAGDLKSRYGNISRASIGAIQRRLLVLEEQRADLFFGEPALAIADLMQVDYSGLGVVNLLDATRLTQESPRLYATFLMWLLSELFEELPEAGDLDKPKLVLFFDEAHILFSNAPKALLEKMTQAVRLVRSKGVGVYFITQAPMDIPEDVLGQLGMKIQHALRAYTPKDRKVIRAAAESFRDNPAFDIESALTELATGEALVSVLDDSGAPSVVQRTLIRPPESQIGPAGEAVRQERVARSPMASRYSETIDRDSAYEMLARKADAAAKSEPQKTREKRRGRQRQGVGEALLKSAARSVGRSLGSRLIRGLFGSLLR